MNILKTWPAFMDSDKVRQVFEHPWGNFYFTLGRGKPKQEIERLYFTHRGRVICYFNVAQIVQNAGQLPKLRSVSNRESEWQIKPDAWVAICPAPCTWLNEEVFHGGFRGYRYFDLESYRNTLDAKIEL